MTFSYELANLNEVIKKYVVVKNKVIVYYLDGSSLEMEYTKEIEENLKNLMIKQALERTISSAPHEVVENLRKSLVTDTYHQILSEYNESKKSNPIEPNVKFLDRKNNNKVKIA